MINNKNIKKVYYLFLFSHLVLWTIIPYISNVNLPLDTIEALAWGSKLDWGYSKHPPLSAFAVELFYKIFGSQDWAYYLLSQIFIIISFIVIFKLSEDFFNNKLFALISILLLEGIYFYNFTSPEFNVNVSQIPFWALSIFFSWRCFKHNQTKDFILLGVFFGLGILSKYLFTYLMLGTLSLFIYLLFKKKIHILNIFITGVITFIILIPHIVWLFDNSFLSVLYGLNRTGGIGSLADHLTFPLILLIKQIGILIPFFIMSFFLFNKKNFKLNFKSEKIIFLFFMVITPILLMFMTSFLLGIKIRTMWMTPYYLGLGILTVEVFKKNINEKKLQKFYIVFLFFFFASPLSYLVVSVVDETKRTDYPGKEISRLVQNKWNDNFNNEIKIVVGDEWSAGNLSYHLASRPIWLNELKDKNFEIKDDQGVIYTGNPKILKKICPGVYGTIKPVGYCMIGRK